MKRILLTITSLFFAAAVFSQEAIQSLVVITDSKNLTGSESAWLPENICDKLESNFKAYTSYKMISSKDKAIRDYQKKSETAGFDENTAIEVGKMVSASHIILLTVSKAGKIYSVTAEVVNSTTGVSIAKHMESGQSTIEELFSTVGCAVDEITVKLCDQLGEPLTPTQKYVLIYGDTNISDSEKLAMFNQEITNYDRQIAELDEEIAKLSQNMTLEDDAIIKKAQLESEKALAEEKRKVAEAEKIRLADIEKAKTEEKIRQAARDDKQRSRISEVSKEVSKKAAELRRLKMNNQSSLGILRVIETKKAALVEIRKNVKSEQTKIKKNYEKECNAKIDAINNKPWRTVELSKGEPTEEAKQSRETEIRDLQTEYKNIIQTEQERIESATEASQYEIYKEISTDWKTLSEKTFYANTVSGNLRITIGEYDGNKRSWEIKYSILCDGLELHSGSSEIKYSDLEALKPSKMPYEDAVDVYDSLFRCYEPVLTFEISYKITPIKDRASTYEYEFYGLKAFDTTSVTRTQSMALSGNSFTCKDTISKHFKQMSPGYDIGIYDHTISGDGTSLTIRSNDGFETFKKDKNYNGSNIKNVTIGSDVTSIDNNIFKDFSNLTTVTIKNGITSIDERAFSGCSNLTSVAIPNSVTSIGNYAFDGCNSLTNITIPDSVISIGDRAFNNCSSLTNIIIPDSVTSIGNYVFNNCSSLTNITIPNNITSIGYSAFSNCSKLVSVTIPNSVTSIDNDAFNGCNNLTNITIPDSVTSIGDRAFQNCSGLTNITIPNSVTSIDNDAFNGCNNLTNITIPDSVTSIGDRAFQNCSSLTNIIIPDSVTSIGIGAFQNCSSLTNITIPNNITSIGYSAFSNCSSLTSVTIPNSVISIGNSAFYGYGNLTTVNYKGTKKQWENISIDYDGNLSLLSATINCDDHTIAPGSDFRIKEEKKQARREEKREKRKQLERYVLSSISLGMEGNFFGAFSISGHGIGGQIGGGGEFIYSGVNRFGWGFGILLHIDYMRNITEGLNAMSPTAQFLFEKHIILSSFVIRPQGKIGLGSLNYWISNGDDDALGCFLLITAFGLYFDFYTSRYTALYFGPSMRASLAFAQEQLPITGYFQPTFSVGAKIVMDYYVSAKKK